MSRQNELDAALQRLRNELNELTTVELRQLCRNLNLRGYSRAGTKPLLIEFILRWVRGDPLRRPNIDEVMEKIHRIKSHLIPREDVVELALIDEELSKRNATFVLDVIYDIEARIIQIVQENSESIRLMTSEGLFLILISELNKLPEHVADELVRKIINNNAAQQAEGLLPVSYRLQSNIEVISQKFSPVYSAHVDRLFGRIRDWISEFSKPEFQLVTLMWYIYFIFTSVANARFDEIGEPCILTDDDLLRIFKEFEQLTLRLGHEISLIPEEIENGSYIENFCSQFGTNTRIRLHPQPWLLYY